MPFVDSGHVQFVWGVGEPPAPRTQTSNLNPLLDWPLKNLIKDLPKRSYTTMP